MLYNTDLKSRDILEYNISIYVLNFYHLMKSNALVMHIHGMKMWSGDAGTLSAQVKLGSGQFLWPDIQPDTRTKIKI